MSTTKKIKRQKMIINLMMIALCEAICENDVEGDFFYEDWVKSALKKGFLEKRTVTDGRTFVDTIEYRVTSRFWTQVVKKRMSPAKYSQMEYFIQRKERA